MLPVSAGHEIYFELSGNPDGAPLMFLHGGPGSGSSPDTRRLFDPTRFQIIQFDQRGCGASRPHGALQHNTTPHLIGDIEALRLYLGLERMHLAGGSWGSTLALAYGVKHPERLRSLLLYGVFLCAGEELDRLYGADGLAAQFFPEVYAEFSALLPEAQRGAQLEGYKLLFESADKALREQALLAWTRLEKAVSRLTVSAEDLARELADPDFLLSHSLIENHYFLNDCFLPHQGEMFLREIGRQLAGVPTHIVNGRYDLICPPVTAHRLHQALPRSTLNIVPASGHSFREPRMTDALMRAAQRF